VTLVNSTTDMLRKPRLRDRTGRAWFSCLLQHPARKWSGSILTTPEPAQGSPVKVSSCSNLNHRQTDPTDTGLSDSSATPTLNTGTWLLTVWQWTGTATVEKKHSFNYVYQLSVQHAAYSKSPWYMEEYNSTYSFYMTNVDGSPSDTAKV